MSKVRPSSIDSKNKYRIIGDFFDLVSGLNSKKEVIDFFIGLLTPSESLMMARRIQIAKMLIDEENYEIIRKKLKVSNQTITKTYNWLYSRGDDYNIWITKHILKLKDNNKKYKNSKNKSLLDKYPHHRFLKELIS
ncbi:trp operon repressor [bacterium BMS3Abin15]|nr:trp operon repressor [bacterium BMS3Abin15]HDZ85689.1 hypothetical protein [Candidatus Moranbacteria bacterium]